MAPFKVGGVDRFDPYKSFMFRVLWDGRTVAGLSKMGPLSRKTTVVAHRDGSDPARQRKSPGVTSYDDVTLERGLTLDREFEAWATKVHATGSPMSLKDFRKDVIVDLYNEAQQKVLSYKLNRCWVSEYTALPQLDAATAAVAIETIKLSFETFDRDTAWVTPAEP
ncbi:phage tail protein [Streptomyces longisporoflavus]|uniref:Phage tail protein n=1 Tax=Streptomyces longisporoflavus TaxID=28044 RepID=A0ABW7QFX8_9ACTN